MRIECSRISAMELLKGLVFVGLLAVANASLFQSRIVGGDKAASYQFTYQVSLRSAKTNSHFCSGAILTERWILSACRCVDTRGANEYYVQYGTRRLSDPGKRTKIAQVYKHPDYNAKDIENDLAMLLTSSKIVFQQGIAEPIALPVRETNVGDVAIVSGWGVTEKIWQHPNNYTDELHFLMTSTVSLKECRQKIGAMASIIHEHKTICTKTSADRGIGSGDQGDPLVSKTKVRQIIGIASSYADYADNIPDVYTAVFPYLKWINTLIGNTADIVA